MKVLFLLSLFSFPLLAQTSDCGPKMIKAWSKESGLTCTKKVTETPNEIYCLAPAAPVEKDWLEDLTGKLFSIEKEPYWAQQGKLLFPNLNYPGAWSYPGIEAKYYPGEGEVFAAKPNVYIESIHAEKKFSFGFEDKPHFLATTPLLLDSQTWRGKLVQKDKYEIDGIIYEYLFYDVRLPKEKMQFEHGVCADRESAIEWMLKDLKEMKYSELAMQDFSEHWRVKIPEYAFYCIYPQYNSQLDPAIPVKIDVEQNTFIRSLYVLVPYKTEPDEDETPEIPFPTKDPAEFRPKVLIQRENMFREWGVAFLGF